MLKHLTLALLGLILLALVATWLLTGMAPRQLLYSGDLVNGLSAKLSCSGRYLSGFDQERLVGDVATYSEATRMVHYHWLESGGVSASLFGSGPAIAKYRPGLGCTLAVGDDTALDTLTPPRHNRATAEWPAGSGGKPVNDTVQTLVEQVVTQDNRAGLDTRALLVVRDGKILGEAYGPGIDKDTALLGWSMGKSLTAIMLGRLEAMRAITVNEANLFPHWVADERNAITVENLLQMTSGLEFSEEYIPGDDSTRMLFSAHSASQVAIQSPLVHQPGSHFSYSSGTTNLLSRLVRERAGGHTQALLDFYQQEIATPLGLEHTTMELDASGNFVGSSYVYASARDWARFGHVLANEGVINGRQIVSSDWVLRATTPNQSENEPRYGYQFWLNGGGEQLRWPSLPRSAYAMQGNRKQVVMVVPEHSLVIVRLGWSAADYPIDRNFARLWQQALGTRSNQPGVSAATSRQ